MQNPPPANFAKKDSSVQVILTSMSGNLFGLLALALVLGNIKNKFLFSFKPKR